MNENRPKLLILGYARHGKDTVAEMLRDRHGLNFMSSSEFVGREVMWNNWGCAHYDTFEEMFEDRGNHRVLWMEMISAYNTPDKTKTATSMLERGYDMYVGMRRHDELMACYAKEIFDLVVWVDRSDHLPPETGSMDITPQNCDATYWIDNNGTLEDLESWVDELAVHLRLHGFSWASPHDSIRAGGRDFTPVPYTPGPRQAVAERPQLSPEPQIEKKDLEEVDLLETPDEATPVLDHGYVFLADVMGHDSDIAEAARLSYGRGTTSVRSPEGLINYLYRHHHTSPFEMVEMKFQMRLPIFVMRQWVRHRTANLNEYSGRYSIMPRLFYVPDLSMIKGQSKTNKQASEGELSVQATEAAQKIIFNASNKAFDDYETLLSLGVSREMARIVLPLNTYTEIVWKMDLNNMLKFLWLRDDSHAQPEIQAYAKVIAAYVEQAFPLTYLAYKESRSRVSLSYPELYAILTGDRSGLSKSQAAESEELQRQLQQWIIDQQMSK